jgi:hypothetical protein
MKTITVEVPVKVSYGRTPYHPAKTSGPPESCYEAEGGELEWEIDAGFDLNAEIENAILEDEKCSQN